MRIGLYGLPGVVVVLLMTAAARGDNQELLPIPQRFASADAEEIPSFQRHVSPLFGRLGCNGRSCHGSFQGQGGFRLSLFGYDFQADHEALMEKDGPRVDVEKPLESLILVKPTDADMHEGGLRYKKDGWEYHVFRRWIEAGAKFAPEDAQKLVRLEVTPAELLFANSGEKVQLKAVAVWPDGTREDVTPLCRFQSNSDQVATIDETGLVTATDSGDTHLVVFYDSAVVPIPVIRPVTDQHGDRYPQVATNNRIDELVLEKLRKLGVVPSELATDAEFLRRVYLDLTGTLPTAAEVESFLADESPDKRSVKIDELLETPAYVAWWTTKLCDFTGNNDRQLNQVNQGMQGSANKAWYDWIYKRIADNVPYDQLVENIVVSQSRREGQSYSEYCQEMSEIYHPDSTKQFADRPTMPYFWARQNLRQPEERAIGFAYTFLGTRIQCAQCHKHPFDQWSKADFDAFKAFFPGVTVGVNGSRDRETQEEFREIMAELGIEPGKRMNGNEARRLYASMLKEGKTIPFAEVYVNQRGGNGNRRPNNRRNQQASAPEARLLGGESVDLTKVDDSRKLLMQWLRDKDNPYFAPAFVNRVWASYFNVGIVQPPDDMSLANPPSNKPLLDYLARSFIENGFDMKWLHREILNSRTYQLSWRPNETNGKDERNFARSVPRRMPAEVAYDAIQAATASDAKAATMLASVQERAIAIPGASPRGRNGSSGFALEVFGRSIRESNCDCDRSMEASLLQTVFLQNDFQVLAAINGGRDTWIDQVSRDIRGTGTESNPRRPEGRELQRQLAQLQRRLKQAREEKDDAQIKRLQQRIADLRPSKEEDDEQTKEQPLSPEQSAELIKQVYLRTVSRYPTGEEMDRCHQYLASSPNPVEGAKGLLWTLLNTKEFIVNH